MSGGDVAFVLLAVNPLGGLLVAIPYGLFTLGYPVALVLALGVPLAYVQVAVVDGAWSALARWPRWERFIAARRSPRVERLAAGRGRFWGTMLVTPLVGPWLVMAIMRYAQVQQQRVAVPILLGLCWGASVITAACLLAPRLFGK